MRLNQQEGLVVTTAFIDAVCIIHVSILDVSEITQASSTQLPATVVKFAERLAGPFVVVVHVYPLRVAAISVQIVPLFTQVNEKFPLPSAVAVFPPHPVTVAVDPVAPNEPDTV